MEGSELDGGEEIIGPLVVAGGKAPLVPLAVEPRTEGEGPPSDDAVRHIGEAAALRCVRADGGGVVGAVSEKDASGCETGQELAPGRCFARRPGSGRR